MRVVLLILAALGISAGLQAQVIPFNGLSGVNSETDDSIDGYTIVDQYDGADYEGYAGEMSLIFVDEGDASSGVPRGTFRGDAGSAYADKLGLVVFCTDINTGFRESASPSESFLYQPYSAASAESRYLSEGAVGYLNGGLKRAAYLIENYYDVVHAGEDLHAAALQVAIWEVLTDADPSLSVNAGKYFLRGNSSQPVLNLRTQQLVDLTDAWFAEAVAADWGGPAYDPGNRVAFWLDPTSVHLNQSVVSLVPESMSLVLVPEPGSAMLLMLGGLVTLSRRRR